jgi:hypothetical protein
MALSPSGVLAAPLHPVGWALASLHPRDDRGLLMGSTKCIPFLKVPDFQLCSECFKDVGLRIEARRIGAEHANVCPNCKANDGYALNSDQLHDLQTQFFSRATAPNQFRQDVAVLGVVEDTPDEYDIGLELRPETRIDWALIRRAIGGRLWFRSPRLFYLGITNHFGLYGSLQRRAGR